MLTPLIFLFMAILAMELAPSFDPYLSLQSAILLSAVSYLVLIAFLRVQKKKFISIYVTHMALILFVLLLFYAIGIQAFFPKILAKVSTLFLYFVALGFGLSFSILRLVLPFSFAYLGYLFLDTLVFPKMGVGWVFGAVALFLILNSLFLPLIIQKIWNCLSFPECSLKKSLEALCEKSHFRFRKMLIWQLLSKDATACVIGVLPRFRYILFTESLVNFFSEDEVKSTLAHEMGHCKHKHLILIPLLLLSAAPLSLFFYPFIEKLPPVLSFVFYALFFFCYIRFFMGFFLRAFEKQADLHIFACEIPAPILIQTFEKLSSLNSIPLSKTSWHHGSLSNRIEILKEAQKDRHFIKRFNFKIHLLLASYLLTIGGLTLYVIFNKI